jgi:hypothetical protein
VRYPFEESVPLLQIIESASATPFFRKNYHLYFLNFLNASTHHSITILVKIAGHVAVVYSFHY